MKLVRVTINSVTNEVSVKDTGDGFYKGTEINDKTGVSNIETAMSQLRAGSNFFNENIDEALIGTNGVGSSLVNMLSSKFVVDSKNKDTSFLNEWKNFIPGKSTIVKKKQTELGTTVSFIPRSDVFKGIKWDKDVIYSLMVFKNYLIKNDDTLHNMKFQVIFDGEELNLNIKFFPDKSFIAKTAIGTLVIYENFENSGSVSFVNSAMCTGIHQKVINDKINIELQDSLGHHFYETFMIFNLPPKVVRFGDQNKTKFVATREEVENIILDAFRPKLKQFYSTQLFESIKKKVEERKLDSDLKKLRSLKKKSSIKNSHKYFPSSGRIENLFIVEGESAMGSILQKRNTKTDGVYSLKGKIKNVRTISDLTDSREIIELMQILDLETDPTKRQFTFKRIIISTDADEDGAHIFSLLVNFFFKWFPYIIDEGRLFSLRIPLMSVENGKTRDYFYDKKEFEEHVKKKKPVKDVRFLKGLGSLDIKDWETVMADMKLLLIRRGDEAKKYMDMAFGIDSTPRKKWLSQQNF
jgi:DNA gyrase/topoisomerase IV subunit B